MSVSLTLRLRREQDCIIDCTAKGLHGLKITLELSDDVGGGLDAAALESDRSRVDQYQADDAAVMADTGYAIKGEERGAVIDRKRDAIGCLGLGVAQQGFSYAGLYKTPDPAAA